jgi:hypothetical protein
MTDPVAAATPPTAQVRRERAIGLACAFGVLAVWTGFALSSRPAGLPGVVLVSAGMVLGVLWAPG